MRSSDRHMYGVVPPERLNCGDGLRVGVAANGTSAVPGRLLLRRVRVQMQGWRCAVLDHRASSMQDRPS